MRCGVYKGLNQMNVTKKKKKKQQKKTHRVGFHSFHNSPGRGKLQPTERVGLPRFHCYELWCQGHTYLYVPGSQAEASSKCF